MKTLIPDNEALLRRAMEANCVREVGGTALKLYYAGLHVEAYDQLRKAWRKVAPPPAVAALLADPALWVEAPPPAAPSGMVDSGPAPFQGYTVRTYWTRWLGLRVAPFSNYLEPVDRPGTVDAMIPLDDAQRRTGRRRRILTTLTTLAAVVAPIATWFPHRVYAYNGFSAPILVSVSGEETSLAPGESVGPDTVFGWTTRLEARTADGRVIDQRDADLTWGSLLYTPGSQAAFAVEDIVYGSDDTPDDPEILPIVPVQSVSADFFFVAAPRTIELPEGRRSAHRRRLLSIFAEAPGLATIDEQASWLAGRVGWPATDEILRTRLEVNPHDHDAALVLEAGLPAAERRAFWAELHRRAPQSTRTTRRWCELEGGGAVLEDLRGAVGAGDRAADHALLSMVTPDPEEALAASAAAIERGSKVPLAWEARADAMARAGRWAEASEAWTAWLGLDGATGAPAAWERARVERIGRLPATGAEEPLGTLLADLVAVEADPGRLGAATRRAGEVDLQSALMLALAAGDAREARRRVSDERGKLPDATVDVDELRVELGVVDNREGLGIRLGKVVPMRVGWTRVAAAAALSLGKPTAADWRAAADHDGDGGPTLADIERIARQEPHERAWTAWAPRHWALASLAAGWVVDAENPAAAQTWRHFARVFAVPGELLAEGAR